MNRDRRNPRPTRIGRLADYLVALFPPWSHIPLGVGIFAWVHFALQAQAGGSALVITPKFVLGALTIVLFTLLLRVYDELKDAEHDIRLAKAGDARYADRPIVTGHVTIADLVVLRWSITAALIAINVSLGLEVALAFAFVFAWTWLSLRWFFWPRVSKSLLLAFATHNPMVLATTAYTTTVFASEFGSLPALPLLAAIFVASWMPFGAWETARKLRLPKDETAYQTYSKIFGIRAAALIPSGFAIVGTAALIPVALASTLSPVYLCLLISATLVITLASIRLVFVPSESAARMQPIAELYLAAIALGFPIASMLKHGVSWA